MKRICVFCGSNGGASEMFGSVARRLGTLLAERGLGLVYGGGNVGLMGVLADAVLAGDGEVIGVIPGSLVERELAHEGLSELIVVQSMHERKAKMADLADGFIAMAGGFGTLDEFCEIVTWYQLGFHQKPCGLLNTSGFWDSFLAHVDHGVKSGFIPVENREMLLVDEDPGALVDRLGKFGPGAPVSKWMDRP